MERGRGVEPQRTCELLPAAQPRPQFREPVGRDHESTRHIPVFFGLNPHRIRNQEPSVRMLLTVNGSLRVAVTRKPSSVLTDAAKPSLRF